MEDKEIIALYQKIEQLQSDRHQLISLLRQILFNAPQGIPGRNDAVDKNGSSYGQILWDISCRIRSLLKKMGEY